jgi:hypothetical protein
MKKDSQKMEIIPGKGVGVLKIGMSALEVTNIVGIPDQESTGTNYLNYREKGISFLLQFDHVRTIFLYSGRIGGYETGDFKHFSCFVNKKIDFDTAYQDVLNEYGPPDGSLEILDIPKPAKQISYDIGISFDFIKKTGKIIFICIQEKKQMVDSNHRLLLKHHKDNRIAIIQQKLNHLQQIIKTAPKNWEPDWLEDVEKLRILKIQTMDAKNIENFESKYNIRLPASYKTFIQVVGAFVIGADELVIRNPLQLGTSLGELIEERIPDHTLDNFQSGHYHDFIIVAEYGYFPSEDDDYSYGLAFNRKNADEMIVYACDEIWFAATPEQRKAEVERDVFFGFLEEKLDCLIDRAEGFIEEIKEEIEE